MSARLLAFVLRADVRPFCDQIAAAYRLDPAPRRIVALALLHRILAAPPSIPTRYAHFDWRALGRLLRACSIELSGNPHALPLPIPWDERTLWFGALGDRAYDISREMQHRIERRRPGRGVPKAERAPRSWRPSGRVIDMATGGAR